MDIVERKIRVSPSEALLLFGPQDQFLRLVETRFDARIIARGDVILLQGSAEEVALIERVFSELSFVLAKSGKLSKNDVTTVIDIISAGKEVAQNFAELESIVL